MFRREGIGRGSANAWRVSLSRVVALCLLLLPASGFAFRGHGGHGGERAARPAYHGSREHAGTQERQAPRRGYATPQQRYENRPFPGPGRGDIAPPPYRGGQEIHLPAWLRSHQGMPLSQQQHALTQEPGFNRLPPQTQRQLMNSLARIDRMSPRQRQRTLGTIEALERLSPQRRQQVMASERELRMMPQNRQRALKQAFLNLRNYPPAERQGMMASPQFQSQFSPRERSILGDMLTVEPYEPPAR